MSSPNIASTQPRVGVITDAATKYGWSIARGVLDFATKRREWLLSVETRITPGMERSWPVCDGLIVAGIPQPALNVLLQRFKRVISCSAASDPARVIVVGADSIEIGRLAGQHLLNSGLLNFGFYGRPHGSFAARLAGFRDTVQINDAACSAYTVPDIPETAYLAHKHWAGVQRWLNGLRKPVGILAGDDTAANDLASMCLQLGFKVPQEVAIVGVNNDLLQCEGAWPPLSSVDIDYRRVGYVAAERLDTLLRGGKIPARQRLTLIPPSSVVRRMSTDVRAIKDVNVADAVAFIETHACDPCSVADLLRHVPVSRTWLEVNFKETLARTPHEEIVRVRMEKARRLLLETDEDLDRIGQRCGYGILQNFVRAFRKQFAVTPSRFRRTSRGRN